MSWSWRIARIRGIDIRIHATFWLLILWIGAAAWFQTHRLIDVGTSALLIVFLFAIVVLHELAHSFVARRFGSQVRDITLLPIGGVSRLGRIPEVPAHEFLIAIAGPAVNVVLALVFLGAILLWGDVPWPGAVSYVPGGLLAQLVAMNLVLAVFNLLPAFPMDGGRVLRSLLALRMGYADATRVAARVGQAAAILFVLVGLFFNPLLMLIGVFIWLGATGEAASAQARALLGDLPVREAMSTSFPTLTPGETLRRAIDLWQSGVHGDLPVVKSGQLVGLVKHSRLLMVLAKDGDGGTVDDVMTSVPESIGSDLRLDLALDRLRETGGSTLPVVDDGRLVGVLTREGLASFLAVRAALQRRRIGDARPQESGRPRTESGSTGPPTSSQPKHLGT